MTDVTMIEAADDGTIAAWLQGRLAAALQSTQGVVSIAVPGGSTPFPIMAKLATATLEWERLAVWAGDDRVVAEDHPASNIGRIREVFASTSARIEPLVPDAEPPHFALVWLGMGGDGHIASLFPSTDPRADDPARVRTITPDPLPPEAPFDRVSLTIPALLDSDAIVFVVRGADKRAVFDAAVAGDSDLPIARLLHAARQPVTCFT